MRVKQSLPRSKAKQKLSLASNAIKTRNCVVKLHRVKTNGVANLNGNEKRQEPCVLLQAQQKINENNVANVNSSKLANAKKLNEKEKAPISQFKMKKCVVKIKRIHLDVNKNVSKLPTKPPICRNPLLALTSRRAKELGIRNVDKVAAPSSATITEQAPEQCPNSKQTDAKNSLSPIETTLPRNLVYKPNIITELLFSEDEEFFKAPNSVAQNVALPKNTVNQSMKTHRFFHKDHKTEHSNERQAAPQKMPKKEKNKKLKSKQIRRSATSANKDIYEFLSQSQTSDSDGVKDHKDVASDIIKKLIEAGKVVVTKNHKGRPRPVRKANNAKNKVQKSVKKTKEQKNFEADNILDADEDDNDDDQRHEQIAVEPAFPNNDLPNPNSSKEDDAHAVADSTFSELARSVLVRREAARNNIATGKKALEILQRYNSTPFKPQQKSPQLNSDVNFSPIQHGFKMRSEKPPNQLLNRPSKLFETKNNSAVPSSSLLINATNETLVHLNAAPVTVTTITELPSLVNDFQKSSFSSNDSNAENQPPPSPPAKPSKRTKPNSGNENEVIHSARQIPNPRRNLLHRSPLKAINIIDIVTLSPYTGPMNANKPNEKSNENISNEKSLEKSKLFGFEEYIDEHSCSDDDKIVDASLTSISNKNRSKSRTHAHDSKLTISKQLRRLKRLRPKLSTATIHSRSTITKNIFDEDVFAAVKTKGNRNIKEMLCSTMLDRQQNVAANATNTTAASDSSAESENEATLEKKTAELFGDPETTFDQKSLHRTYARPFKRKRKLIHQYSDVFDSEDEHTDDEADAHNSSNAMAKPRKAKKHHSDGPSNEELEKFAEEFNSMLKEAEDYELIVE